MDKKVVLITGASNGIGAQMAKSFAKSGYCVVINYNKSKDSADKLATQICENGGNAISFHADVSDYSQVCKLVEYTLEVFGHIDVLINNAGVSSYKLLIDEDQNNIMSIINTNLIGTINCSKIVAKAMLNQGHGKIINMSSIWGVCGGSGESVYSASKGGVIAFTKALSKELAYSNITVNSISPGVVNTNMLNHFSESEKLELKEQIPLGRFIKPEEVASTALFLASDDADCITGQNIVIDGGFIN